MEDRLREHAPLVPIQPLFTPEYYDALHGDLIKAGSGDRISITTMSFEPSDPQVDRIVADLAYASNNGAVLQMGVDAYALMLESTWPVPGPMWLRLPIGQGIFKRRAAAMERLNSNPTARVSVVNQPGRPLSNVVANRSHIKMSVVNEQVYIPNGNLNLSGDADLALSFQHAPTAEWLHGLAGRIIEAGNARAALNRTDQAFRIDSRTHALADAGNKGSSMILDEAIRIIDESDEWLVLATQYLPQPPVMQRLVKACMRGVDVRVPFNDPAIQGLTEKLPERWALHKNGPLHPAIARGRLPLHGHKLHVKALASEKEAVVGGHNYDPRGVMLGTAELSIVRSDALFAHRIGSLVMQHTGGDTLPSPRGALELAA